MDDTLAGSYVQGDTFQLQRPGKALQLGVRLPLVIVVVAAL